LIATLVAGLRAIPFLITQIADPPAGQTILPVGYLPRDMLAYVALVRQAELNPTPTLLNPFTTEPQSGRYLSLLLWLLGLLCRAPGLIRFGRWSWPG
jgi:hypothetical protein